MPLLILLFSDLMFLNFAEDTFFKEIFLCLNVHWISNMLSLRSLAIVTLLHMTEWSHFSIQLADEHGNLVAEFLALWSVWRDVCGIDRSSKYCCLIKIWNILIDFLFFGLLSLLSSAVNLNDSYSIIVYERVLNIVVSYLSYWGPEGLELFERYLLHARCLALVFYRFFRHYKILRVFEFNGSGVIHNIGLLMVDEAWHCSVDFRRHIV